MQGYLKRGNKLAKGISAAGNVSPCPLYHQKRGDEGGVKNTRKDAAGGSNRKLSSLEGGEEGVRIIRFRIHNSNSGAT